LVRKDPPPGGNKGLQRHRRLPLGLDDARANRAAKRTLKKTSSTVAAAEAIGI
jgi:hypothetical protein